MDILCMGMACVDVIVHPIEEVDFSIILKKVDGIEAQTGGDGLNVALNIGKLGCDAAFAAHIGKDGFGEIILQALRRNGINTGSVAVDQNCGTSAAINLVKADGSHCFLLYGGGNDAMCAADVSMEYLKEAKIVHASGVFQTPKFDRELAGVMKKAQELGKITTMDVNWDHTGKWMETISECMPYLDYFMPSEEEAQCLTGGTDVKEIAENLLDRGVKNVIIKCGGKGAYFKNAEREFLLEPHSMNAVDTTGAGDSFVSGVLCGLVKGWDIEQCMRLGTAVAGLCVERIGAAAGTSAFSEALTLMKEKPVKLHIL